MAKIYSEQYNGSTIAILKIEENLEELINLSGMNISYLENYKNPKRKIEVAAVRALLFTLLGEYNKIFYN